MSNTVTVLGSLNVDTIVTINHMPLPGETISSHDKSSAAGGKGANQAIAAVRAGADVNFVGKVGQDDAGQFMLKSLADNDVDTSNISEDANTGTGSAIILLDDNGQNSIVVYGGTNQLVGTADIESAQAKIKESDFLIAQFETPQAAALEAFKYAKSNGVITILNPAPAAAIMPELLTYTDIIVPNETESETLTGIKVTDEASMLQNFAAFQQMGVKNLVITVGDKGAFYANDQHHEFIPAFKVNAVDTTAAGDTFIGALSSQLTSDLQNMGDAIAFAQKASSITVQGFGAIPSIPHLSQILETSHK